jgi:hypothetical protein
MMARTANGGVQGSPAAIEQVKNWWEMSAILLVEVVVP